MQQSILVLMLFVCDWLIVIFSKKVVVTAARHGDFADEIQSWGHCTDGLRRCGTFLVDIDHVAVRGVVPCSAAEPVLQ